MTEDGRDWGERCVDMYKIVDKVTRKFSVFSLRYFIYVAFLNLALTRLGRAHMVRCTRQPLHQRC